MLRSRAEGGDPAAELELALRYMQRDERESALTWIEKSIARRHGDSLYTMAVWLTQGMLVPQDHERASQLLQQGTGVGHAGCRSLLAVSYSLGLGVEPSWREAVSLMIGGAIDKDPQALRQLAVLLHLTGRRPQHAHRLMFQAIIYGDVPARYLMAQRMLRGEVKGFGPAMAVLLMEDAARLGFGPAQTELPALARHRGNNPGGFGDEWAGRSWASQPEFESCRKFLLDGLTFPTAVSEPVSDEPHAMVFRKCLPEELCDYLRMVAYPHMRPSSTVDTRTGQLIQTTYRTSSSMAFAPMLLDLVVHCVNLRYAALLDLPAETGEILSVLRYQPGEEYKAHSDYFVMGPEGRDELERNGQRIYTLFSTLHPAELGGTTSFPKAEIVVTLGKGDALAFRNVDEDGEPDPMSIHQGDRVDRGEKWLAVKWFRTKPYQL